MAWNTLEMVINFGLAVRSPFGLWASGHLQAGMASSPSYSPFSTSRYPFPLLGVSGDSEQKAKRAHSPLLPRSLAPSVPIRSTIGPLLNFNPALYHSNKLEIFINLLSGVPALLLQTEETCAELLIIHQGAKEWRTTCAALAGRPRPPWPRLRRRLRDKQKSMWKRQNMEGAKKALEPTTMTMESAATSFCRKILWIPRDLRGNHDMQVQKSLVRDTRTRGTKEKSHFKEISSEIRLYQM